MSSRLFLEVREAQGLAYAVDSSLSMLDEAGLLVVYAGVDAERAPQAIRAVLGELDRLRQEPVPEAELHKAREYVKGRLVLGLEDSGAVSAWHGQQALLLVRFYRLLYDRMGGDGVAMRHWLRVENEGLGGVPHLMIVDDDRLAEVVRYLEISG